MEKEHLTNEALTLLQNLQQCRLELDTLFMPHPASWIAVEAWSAKWRLSIGHFFPSELQGFDALIKSPQWLRPQNSLYRMTENPSNFVQRNRAIQGEQIIFNTVLDTLAEQNKNQELFSQCMQKLRSFIDGLIGFIKTYGLPNALRPAVAIPQRRNAINIRKLLNEIFRTDSDLEAFCIDHFPSVGQSFTNGMDRVAKINLLLKQVTSEDIYQKLQAEHQSRIDELSL